MIKTLTRREVGLGMLALGALFSAPAWGKEKAVKIRLGYLPFPVEQLFAGIANGLFEKSGLEIELTKFTSGPAEFQALQSGSLDLAHGALAAFYMGTTRGLKAKWVYAFGNNAKQGGLVVPGDANIQSIADLKGKRVAAPSGSILHLAHLFALRKAGMAISEVNFVSLQPPQEIAALRGGDIDAAWLWDPFVSDAKKGGAKLAFTNDALGITDVFGLTANVEWLEKDENKGTLVRLFKAFDAAMQMYRSDPNSTLDTVVKLLGIDRQLAERLMKGAEWYSLADQVGKSSMSMTDPDIGAMHQIDWIESTALWGGLIKQKGMGEDFLDAGPARRASQG
jgi:taurine transport system substrate-binding protein